MEHGDVLPSINHLLTTPKILNVSAALARLLSLLDRGVVAVLLGDRVLLRGLHDCTASLLAVLLLEACLRLHRVRPIALGRHQSHIIATI